MAGVESIYMTEEELLVLLAGKGKRYWYGIDSREEEEQRNPFKKEDLYRILGDLYQKEYVEWDQNMVKINESMDPMMQVLIGAECCVRAENEKDKRIYYFDSSGIVMMEKSQRENGMLRLTLLEKAEFFISLREAEFLPEDSLEPESEQEIVKQKEEMTEKAFLQLIKMDGEKQLDAMKIMEAGITTFISQESGTTTRVIPYETEWLQKQLSRWMDWTK